MAKPKALCITTKYRTLGELIERMHAYCDDASMFVATSTLLRVGDRRTFALRYVDRSVAIEGFCVVLHAWRSGGNPFGKPGLLLSLEQLTIESQRVFDALAARRREVARAHPARSHARARTNHGATVDPSTVRLAPRAPVSNATAPLAIVARAPARGISITAEVAAAVLPGGIAEHSSVTAVDRPPEASRGARMAARRARTTMPARPRAQVSGGRTSRTEALTCQTSPLPRLGGQLGVAHDEPDDGMGGMLANDLARGTLDMDPLPQPYIVVRDGFDDGAIPLDELTSPAPALDIRHPRAVQWSVVFATVSAILALAVAVAILR